MVIFHSYVSLPEGSCLSTLSNMSWAEAQRMALVRNLVFTGAKQLLGAWSDLRGYFFFKLKTSYSSCHLHNIHHFFNDIEVWYGCVLF